MRASDLERQIRAIALLDEPRRRRLYRYVLTRRREVGRDEAARALHMSRALAAVGDPVPAGPRSCIAARPARSRWRSRRGATISPHRSWLVPWWGARRPRRGGRSDVPRARRAASSQTPPAPPPPAPQRGV